MADVPEEEAATLVIGPSFANRFYVRVGPHITRIAMGEVVIPGRPVYHSAVVVPTVDAVGLAKLILQLFEKNQSAQAPPSAETPSE